MVSSRVYPDLERKPGGPDNWVEAAGGLPSYIERIAKHLHYERGFSISRAIATAVNTVKRWAKGGTVTKYGTTRRISAATQAKALAAVASWEAKKKAGALALTDELLRVIDLTEAGDDITFDLLDLAEIDEEPPSKWSQFWLWVVNGGSTQPKSVLGAATSADEPEHAILGSSNVELSQGTMDIQTLADRANAIEDPAKRALARQSVLDLASTIAPQNPSGKATDGRRRYKNQGKWGHGFVPLDRAAKEAKAKGSPIAIKRLNRIFGTKKVKAATGRAGSRSAGGLKKDPKEVLIDEETRPGAERVKDVGFMRHSAVDADTNKPEKRKGTTQKEASKASRIPERATQNWDEIPETLKTVRNGKRYVVAEFDGKQFVTEWLGGVKRSTDSDLEERKVMRTITAADALKMSEDEVSAMLANPKTPDHVKKVLRKSLKDRKKDGNDVK